MPLFLKKEVGLESGDIVDKRNKVLGRHSGLHFYTIGQRRGIKLAGGPWWVLDFDRRKNQLVVTNQKNDPALFKQKVIMANCHFISGQAPRRIINVKAKTRFNQPLKSAKLYPPRGGKISLFFDKSQKAITPGQWAVFYQGQVCLGGGMIEK